MRHPRRTWPTAAARILAISGLVLTAVPAAVPAQAATGAPTLDLKILLVGATSSDPTTAAWEATLTNEGVPYTEVDAVGAAGSQTVTLPTLSSGTTGYFNGVVVADSPADFAPAQLSALYTYESTFGIRQIDGYVYPSSTLGLTAVSGGALDGTTGTLTSAGLSALPELAGPVPFDTGTYGYAATAVAGAPVTPVLTNAAGNILASIYQHPAGDPQAGSSELSLGFDYNANQLQWLLLGPGLINWVTQNTHLGEYRNYVEMDIDDTFTPDDSWDTTTHSVDYTDADALRMQAADVDYAAQWSQANGFRMDQLFNGGGSVEYQSDNNGPDPVLAEFQKTDPTTGKPYADDFGWLSHTYDTPYLDVGCATQNYIEAELNENTNWAGGAAGATAGTGGLGLTETTNTADALGTENPQVFVPGNHSGLADLVPGNPATVDPPDLDPSTVNTTGGTLAAGSYQYAVTDQFTNDVNAGQSQAYVTAPLTVPAGGSVSLQWEAICHASNYLVYREPAGSGDWTLLDNYSTPASATLPDNSSGDPVSTTDVTNGGEQELTYNDTGAAGTAEPNGWTPPTTENAVETPWEQNPYFIPALEAVGITVVGADASKAYPDPSTDEFGIGATYTGATYAAGQTFVDGTAQVAPRHPINIYYNASTEAQQVDEYNTLYLPPSLGGQCEASSTTTCLTAPATFADVVNQVVEGMFQNMMANDPRPSYVHQTNIMGQPPAGPATTGTPPNTPDTTGDGLLYSVLNPLLSEYHSYFNSNTPFEQPTLGAIGAILADQSAWTAAESAGTVSASETNGVISVVNSGSAAINVPITAPTGAEQGTASYGQAYGGVQSAWTSIAGSGTLSLTQAGAPAFTSAAAASFAIGQSGSFTITATGTPAPPITESGTLPSGLTFTAGANGSATITGTPAAGTTGSYPITLTAQNSIAYANQTLTLSVGQAPAITSANSANGADLNAFSFTITSTGSPAATISESGSLPPGLKFTAGTNGTATITGTPNLLDLGAYKLTLTAKNSAGTATQAFTINVALLNIKLTTKQPAKPTATASPSASASAKHH